jgi:teichuronic acid biosynthesis glycosyltransferase TuaG
MNTNIDIIVPNFNKGKYLDECLNSVILQDYKNWILYIIDDNSDDNSKNILSKYKDNPKIKIIELKKNKGPAFCRNLGMRISNSNFVSFLDSDDFWVPNKISSHLKFMLDGNLNFTFSDYQTFFEKDDIKKYIKKTNITNMLNFKKFIKNSSINTSTMVLKRSIIKNTKFKNVGLLEDYLFKCDLFKQGISAHKVDKNLAFYRVLESSRSSSRFKNIFQLWRINKKYNKLNFFNNMISILMISFNSIKKYGLK